MVVLTTNFLIVNTVSATDSSGELIDFAGLAVTVGEQSTLKLLVLWTR
jgi:hypothetical protein